MTPGKESLKGTHKIMAHRLRTTGLQKAVLDHYFRTYTDKKLLSDSVFAHAQHAQLFTYYGLCSDISFVF